MERGEIPQPRPVTFCLAQYVGLRRRLTALAQAASDLSRHHLPLRPPCATVQKGRDAQHKANYYPYPAGPPPNPLLCAGWLLHDSRPVHFLMVSGDPTAHRAIAPRRALMLERSTTDHALAGTRLMPPRRAPSLIAGFAYAARGAVAGRQPLTAASYKQLAATIAALLAPLRGHLGAA
jgi:hypothetical protein